MVAALAGRGRAVAMTFCGAVVANMKGISIGTDVTGGRVEFVTCLSGTLDAPNALEPFVVGVGVAMFE